MPITSQKKNTISKNRANSGRDLIKRIKPSLANAPIISVDMSMSIDDVSKITVVYAVTDEVLRVLSDHEIRKTI